MFFFLFRAAGRHCYTESEWTGVRLDEEAFSGHHSDEFRISLVIRNDNLSQCLYTIFLFVFQQSTCFTEACIL